MGMLLMTRLLTAGEGPVVRYDGATELEDMDEPRRDLVRNEMVAHPPEEDEEEEEEEEDKAAGVDADCSCC
mgnify:FL=1